MTARQLLDPTSERLPAHRERTPRPASLDGLTIGLLDIAKARGDVYLDRVEEHLTERGLQVKRFRKPTFTKVLPPALTRSIIERADAVIEALAD
jgi:hypothetical protein